MRISFILLILFFSESIASQQSIAIKIDTSSTEILEKVIITGTRTKRTLASLPLNAEIITKNDIEKNNSSRLSDIINEQTGLITIPDFGGVEGIQMQGLDSQYTLILLDNQPLIGRSAGTFDLNRITLGNVNQIEIIRGASSSLYGNEALAGVVNIISEKPKFVVDFYASFSPSRVRKRRNKQQQKLNLIRLEHFPCRCYLCSPLRKPD